MKIDVRICRIVSKERGREKMGEDEKVCPLVDERLCPETLKQLQAQQVELLCLFLYRIILIECERR